MEETISLQELFQTLKKRIGLIAVITILAVMASAIISYFVITPIYQSSTQILVNQSKNEQGFYNPGEVQTNLQLVNTYNVIIKSPAILELVAKDLNLNMTVQDLNNKITINSEQNSQVIKTSVQDSDPVMAATIANKTAEVFQKEIKKIMNVDNVTILAKAETDGEQSPVKPQPLLNIAIALVVGLMVGVGLAFLLEYLDNTVKTEQDVENLLELPVLGVITQIEGSEKASTRAGKKVGMRGETVGS